MISTTNINHVMPHDRAYRLKALGLSPAKLDRLLGLGWVRPADHADAASLTEIFNQTALSGRNSPTDSHSTLAEMECLIQQQIDTDWPIWVCISHQSVVAFMLLRPFSWNPRNCCETAELAIYIDAAWQGIGLAPELTTLAFVLAEQKACHNVAIWVLAKNQASLKFTRKIFSEWAHLPSLASSAGELCDVYVLGTQLAQWFASPPGRRARCHQMEAAAQLSTADTTDRSPTLFV